MRGKPGKVLLAGREKNLKKNKTFSSSTATREWGAFDEPRFQFLLVASDQSREEEKKKTHSFLYPSLFVATMVITVPEVDVCERREFWAKNTESTTAEKV